MNNNYDKVTKLYCGHYMQVPGFKDHLSIKATTEWPKRSHLTQISLFWTIGPE